MELNTPMLKHTSLIESYCYFKSQKLFHFIKYHTKKYSLPPWEINGSIALLYLIQVSDELIEGVSVNNQACYTIWVICNDVGCSDILSEKQSQCD